MKIAVIIILYNEYLKDSVAYNSLKKKDVDIFFFDNSVEEKYIQENKKERNHYTLNKNVGLAIGYNYIIKIIKDNYKYIITSDSDTLYPNNYIKEFLKKKDHNLVYIPDIINKEKNKKVNPRKKKNKYIMLFTGKYDNSLAEEGYYYTINSGVIYDTTIFNKILFNEKLFVENIDYDMFDKLSRNKIKAKRIKIDLLQDYSSNDKNAHYIKGRINKTYVDHLEYYGVLWYFLSLLIYIKNGMIEKKKKKYLKAYYNIYIKKGN